MDQELGPIVPLGLDESKNVDPTPPIDPALPTQKIIDYSNSTKENETTSMNLRIIFNIITIYSTI